MGNPTLPKWHRLITHPTAAELAAEEVIASLGRPYRFQWLVWRYILDFAFLGPKVAVEIDGSSHDTPAAKQKDAERTAWLEKQGWRVVRFSNADALHRPDHLKRTLLEIFDA